MGVGPQRRRPSRRRRDLSSPNETVVPVPVLGLALHLHACVDVDTALGERRGRAA